MFLGVKIPKILTPYWVFIQTFFSKFILSDITNHTSQGKFSYQPHFTMGCYTAPYQGVRFFENFFRPSDVPYGGRILKVKNPKNRTPKVILHPNRIFKNHHFVVIVRSVEETAAIAVYDKYVIWSSYY